MQLHIQVPDRAGERAGEAAEFLGEDAIVAVLRGREDVKGQVAVGAHQLLPFLVSVVDLDLVLEDLEREVAETPVSGRSGAVDFGCDDLEILDDPDVIGMVIDFRFS